MSAAPEMDFATAKGVFLRFAETLGKAQDPKQLLDRLQADTGAPYHSFDLVVLTGAVENVGTDLAALLDDELIKQGLFDADQQG